MGSKPTAAELKRRCPRVPIEFLERYLEEFGGRYFESFETEDFARHARSLASLGGERLLTLDSRPLDPPSRLVEITITAFNYSGELPAITGALSSSGFEIVSGDVFTSRKEAGTSERRRIVDRFTGSLAPGVSLEGWRDELQARLGALLGLFERGDERSRASAKARLYESVALSLAEGAAPARFLLPVEIATETTPDGYTRLSVIAEDTPFFLFGLATALALHDVSVERVRIRTAAGRVNDEVDFVDSRGEPITDPEAMNQIKLSVLFTKQFTYFLGKAPDPAAALLRFESIIQDLLSASGGGERGRLLANPRILEDLARVLGASDFIWEDFIRGQYETLLPILAPSLGGAPISHDERELGALLDRELAGCATLGEKRLALNRFKDNEIYLIDLDHLVTPGLDFLTLSRKLTALAEAVVGAAVSIAWSELVERHGVPRSVAGLPARFALLGLGKLGGQALGYASDIELMFVYSDSGDTDASAPPGERLANREFFEKLFKDAMGLIEAKREGIFHVDLRLRPYGRNSPIAVSLDTFCRYYGPGGEAHSYERLSLVRMRAFGGDVEFGRQIERLRDEMVYASDSISVKDLRELRGKQHDAMTKGGRLNAKFSPGALVDLEYSVQIVQCLHGRDNPRLRTPSIHDALEELARAGFMSREEAGDLIEAYRFLRMLINSLRLLRGSAKDLFLPPEEADEYTHLARRMGYARQFGLSPARLLHLEFETRTATVRAFVERYLGRDSLPGPPVGNAADLVLAQTLPPGLSERILAGAGLADTERALTNLRSLAGAGRRRLVFARLAVLAWDELRKSPDPDMALNNWERYTRGRLDPEEHFERLLEQPRRLEILLAIFSGSQFLSDELVREPALFSWMADPAVISEVRSSAAMAADLQAAASREEAGPEAWRAVIRRFRRREILRIGTRDLCLGAPLAEIVAELSSLAETILAESVRRIEARIGAVETCERAGFCVLAFGKLGGRELNYSSDIDLLGIYARGAEAEARVCGAVMEQLRSDLSDPTADGFAYRVDLRLRPYGRSGALVWPVAGLLPYYRSGAALWEFQALLKLRPVAGRIESGEAFVESLRPLLFRERDRRQIYDSIARLRDARSRPSQDAQAPGGRPIDVKNGPGGLRDIEFLAQAIQLAEGAREPGIVTGNTEEALRRLAERGILAPETAEALAEDYRSLRRIEHFLQLYEDRQTHVIPEGKREVEILARRIDGRLADAEGFLERLRAILSRVRSTYEGELARALLR